jgi:hypothetical protein
LGYKPLLDTKLLDAAMLALGRALYLCSSFERKCRSVLRYMYVGERLKERKAANDPVDSLEELFSNLPDVKMLAGTIKDMSAKADLIGMTEEDQRTLARARDARNFIAHNATDIGTLDYVQPKHVAEFIAKLRVAVADVAAGDDFVSRLIYQIEEPGEPIPHITANYVDLIDLWVFGHLIPSQDPALWTLLYHRGLPGIPSIPRRDIRLPRAARRPPSPLRSANKRRGR